MEKYWRFIWIECFPSDKSQEKKHGIGTFIIIHMNVHCIASGRTCNHLQQYINVSTIAPCRNHLSQVEPQNHPHSFYRLVLPFIYSSYILHIFIYSIHWYIHNHSYILHIVSIGQNLQYHIWVDEHPKILSILMFTRATFGFDRKPYSFYPLVLPFMAQRTVGVPGSRWSWLHCWPSTGAPACHA